MCGIVGYVGNRDAVPILLKALEHLEYRGYDSAGIACLDKQSKKLLVVKKKGKLAMLREELEDVKLESHIGIGHTRWATHGEPSEVNAHPHVDRAKRLALIHNGIIENYSVLKSSLQRQGFRFCSQTDTEVAVNLISRYYQGHTKLESALCQAVRKLKGFFSFVVLSREEPDRLFLFKRSNPLVIGLGVGENFVASDVTAFLPYTNRAIYLEDDEYGIVTRDAVRIYSLRRRKPILRKPVVIQWNVSQAQKDGYPHFMLKEIYEQPRVMSEIISKRLDRKNRIVFDTLTPTHEKRFKKIKRIYLISCGTAYHASLVGSYMAGKFLRLPAQAAVSSEFRYEEPVVGPDDLVVLITQSGETADTLAALRLARTKKAMTLAIVNVLGSTIAREADAVIYTHAGPEIGVASTKAYTAQLATLTLFVFYLARLKGTLSQQEIARLLREFRKLPAAITTVLKQEKMVERCARKHYYRRNFLYLGRGYNFPTALEGALKLKEISYAHAHGYAAGEMKHGPIALVDHEQPVICIAPQSKTYDKMISNIQEIKARDGIVISVGTEGSKSLKRLSDDFFAIPACSEVFSPILTVLILQLLAYKVAVLNGRDVDQPRNLAKSVTVE